MGSMRFPKLEWAGASTGELVGRFWRRLISRSHSLSKFLTESSKFLDRSIASSKLLNRFVLFCLFDLAGKSKGPPEPVAEASLEATAVGVAENLLCELVPQR